MGVTYINPYRFGVAFSPLDLSPLLWLDASDTSTITASGSPAKVSQWNNKGSAGNLTQATAASQPTSGATTLNGLNVIDFDGGDGLVASSLSQYNALHNGTPSLLAVVAKTTSTTGVYAGNHDGGGGKIGFYFFKATNNRLWHVVSPGFLRNIDNLSGNNAVGAGNELLTVLWDADASPASARSSIFRNAGSAIANNTSTTAVTTSNATDPIAVGCVSVGGVLGSFMTGFIAEIVIVTGTDATEANRVALQNYLNTKWAVY